MEKNGGILKSYPVIDYAIGNVAPGVFVIFTSAQKSVIEELRYLKMGLGPNFLLYKPYHLGNIESPLSIYDIAYDKRPTLQVKDKIITSVAARAKRKHEPGSILDTAGGYDFYGYAMDYDEMQTQGIAPLGLVEKSKVKKRVAKGELITFKDIDCSQNIFFKLIS